MRPALIDSMSWAMAEVYGAVTDRILVNLARHFPYVKDADEVRGAFEYQARMLGQMGQVNRETADIIMQSLNGADAALRQALETAILDALKTEEPKLRKAAEKGLLQGAGLLPPEMSANQMQAFQAYYQQSADKLNLVNTVMLESTQAAYTATVTDVAARIGRTQSILNVGAGEVVTGVSSWNQAMHDAVKKMVTNGLTGFIDHGGHKWSPEAYVAMDIRTTMFNTARAAVWERAGQYGADLYQVSSHNGARPLCYPWQGKVISRSDWTGTVEDLDGNKVQVYAQSETSYGQAAGLFGVNCKHYPMTFIPGFSTLKGEPQDPEENAKAYAESQQQRALERKLREEKRDLEVMKAQGADPEAIKAQRAKVAKASSDIDDFCEETGRARRRNREYTPVNAKFPPKDSYNPAEFPTEQRDRINDWFRNGGDNPPPHPTNIHLGPDNIPPQGQAQIPIGAGNNTATIPPSDAYKSGVNDSKPSRNGNSGKTEKDMEFMRNLEREREKVDSMNPMQKGAYLLKHGVSSKEELLEAAKNGTIQDHVDRYFNALNKNGSYASSKPLIVQPTISEETAKSVGWTKARMEKMSDITGLSGDEGVHVFDQMTKWTSNMWGDADTSAIDRYIDSDGTYDGTIWRGLHFGTEDEYREFAGSAFIGDEIHAGHPGKNASWSSLKADATTFASTGDYQVVIQCVGNKSGAPISYLNQKGEQEVVAHSEAWYTVVGRKEVDTGSGKRLEITVVEKEVRKP